MTRFICVNTIFCLLLANRWSEAFTSVKFGDGHCHRQRPIVLRAIPTPEQSVQAFQDYMSKSHEEKLKAVKQVEAQKQTEIEVCTDVFREEICHGCKPLTIMNKCVILIGFS